jgi:hypothetical protein
MSSPPPSSPSAYASSLSSASSPPLTSSSLATSSTQHSAASSLVHAIHATVHQRDTAPPSLASSRSTPTSTSTSTSTSSDGEADAHAPPPHETAAHTTVAGAAQRWMESQGVGSAPSSNLDSALSTENEGSERHSGDARAARRERRRQRRAAQRGNATAGATPTMAASKLASRHSKPSFQRAESSFIDVYTTVEEMDPQPTVVTHHNVLVRYARQFINFAVVNQSWSITLLLGTLMAMLGLLMQFSVLEIYHCSCLSVCMFVLYVCVCVCIVCVCVERLNSRSLVNCFLINLSGTLL